MTKERIIGNELARFLMGTIFLVYMYMQVHIRTYVSDVHTRLNVLR